MGYHDLSECTLSPEERSEEAGRIIQMLSLRSIEYTQREEDFISQMITANAVSVKQLFWLRDIKEKYL